jgi:hypothetical protein
VAVSAPEREEAQTAERPAPVVAAAEAVAAEAPNAPPSAQQLDPAAVIRLQQGAGNAAVNAVVEGGKQNGAGPPAAAEAQGGAAAKGGEAAGAAPAHDGAKEHEGPAAAGAPAAAAPKEGSAAPPEDEVGPEAAAPEGGAPAAAAPGDGGAGRPANPEEHPGFQQAKAHIEHAGAKSRAHPAAHTKAAEAQAAAVGPPNEAASQAKAGQVDTMGAAKPKGFDKAAFVGAVQEAVAKAAPQNLEEADDFKSSGKAAKVKDEVGGLVKGGKEASQQEIKQSAEAPPDTTKATPKQVTPMREEHPGPAPPPAPAAAAMPPPAAPAAVDLQKGPANVNAQMADANVTEEQLAESNEPEFKGAVGAKKEAEVHAAEAPQAYRKEEKETLEKSKGEAQAASKTGASHMHGKRAAVMGALTATKSATKVEDEAKRAKVAADIEAIYEKTKTEVKGILDGLDKKVDSAFETEEKAAREAFENYVDRRMSAYKEDRYGGWGGGLKWAKDKLFGMPDAVNVFYTEGRDGYLRQMNAVIGRIADIVATDLNAATLRIAQGRAEVAKYVASLPADLKKVGKEAEEKVQSRFDELDADVESKQNELVDTLAQKYSEAQKALDDRITEMKEANKGLVDKAIDAVKGVIDTILKLKDMLLNILARAVEAIGDIIAHPIRFLENFVGAIKAGLSKFMSRIWEHLENALMDWLFGAVSAAGITLPKTLDFKGILDLVLQILGLTYQAIRSRVAKVVGEPVVSRLEQVADVFKTLVTEGAAGLWKWIQNLLSNLEDMVLGQIKTFVVERVIKAGITWLIGLLNPAAAFIKACKAIYDIVMFFVEKGSQIMEFVNSVLDSIISIAKGGVGGVPDLIERTLGKILPLVIGFLASLLGLGGISEKVKEVIDTVRKPITKIVDKVVMGAVKTFMKTFGRAIGWVKGKVTAGKAWVKGKVEAGKKWVKGKVAGIRERITGAPAAPEHETAAESFEAGGEHHRLWIDVSGGRARPMIASEVSALRAYIGQPGGGGGLHQQILDRAARLEQAGGEQHERAVVLAGARGEPPPGRAPARAVTPSRERRPATGPARLTAGDVSQMWSLWHQIDRLVSEIEEAGEAAAEPLLHAVVDPIRRLITLINETAGGPEEVAETERTQSLLVYSFRLHPDAIGSPGRARQMSGSLRGFNAADTEPALPRRTHFEITDTGDEVDRRYDAERKLLETLAGQVIDTLGLPDPDSGPYWQVQGELSLMSELPICRSCQGVIGQFRRMFRGVMVNAGSRR